MRIDRKTNRRSDQLRIVEEILEFLKTKQSGPEGIAKAIRLPRDGVRKILNSMVKAGLVKEQVRISSLGLGLLKLPTRRRRSSVPYMP